MQLAAMLRAVSALAAALSLFAACGDHDEDGGTHEGAACEAIMEACHEVDNGTPGPINDCHEIAHEGPVAACESQQERCVALCLAAAGDAAAGDAASDATQD